MIKIGVLTLYYKNYNFGGLLQAYALVNVLTSLFECDAEQIQYNLYEDRQYEIGETDNQCARSVNQFLYQCAIRVVSKMTERKIQTRKKTFEDFMSDIPHGGEVYNYQTISQCIGQYDVLICGGDQIWNASNGIENLKVFTLQFSNEIRKFSYAPSMAILELDDKSRECMRNGISDLNSASVREKSSLGLLCNVVDQRIEVVVDPVLLMTGKEWKQICRPNHPRKPYIVCYLINDSISQRKAITKYANALKRTIVTFPHNLANAVRKCDLFFGDIKDYTSGPREFVDLISNADLVITDSFHACVFSMIFETPFLVFERNRPDEKGNMNSRIYDFLEEYHLEGQLITEKQIFQMVDIPYMDFEYAHKHWKKRRKESLDYIEKGLFDCIDEVTT